MRLGLGYQKNQAWCGTVHPRLHLHPTHPTIQVSTMSHHKHDPSDLPPASGCRDCLPFPMGPSGFLAPAFRAGILPRGFILRYSGCLCCCLAICTSLTSTSIPATLHQEQQKYVDSARSHTCAHKRTLKGCHAQLSRKPQRPIKGTHFERLSAHSQMVARS